MIKRGIFVLFVLILSVGLSSAALEAYASSQEVNAGESVEFELYSNTPGVKYVVDSLPNEGRLYSGSGRIAQGDLPYELSSPFLRYETDSDFEGHEQFSFFVRGVGETSESVPVFLFSVRNCPDNLATVPPITEDWWENLQEYEGIPEMSKQDYLDYATDRYDYWRPIYLSYLGDEYNSNGMHWGYAEALYHTITGDEEAYENAITFLKAYEAYYSEGPGVGADRSFQAGEHSVRAAYFLQQSPLYNANDERFLEEHVAFVFDERLSRERGTHNRAMTAAATTAIAVELYPENGFAKEMEAYRDEVFNIFWDNKSIGGENSNNYDLITLEALSWWFRVTEQEDLFLNAGLREEVEGFLMEVSPAGIVAPYGDGAGFNYRRSFYHPLLEHVAEVYQDGRYKTLSYLVFDWTISRSDEGLENIGEDQAYIRDLMEAYILSSDAISPEALDFDDSLLTYSNRDIPSYWVSDEVVPNKVIFRSGSEGGDMFALLELKDRSGHGHCDTGSLNFLSSGGSVLLADGGYYIRNHTYHNAFQVGNRIGSACPGSPTQYGGPPNVDVNLFKDSPVASFVEVEIDEYANTLSTLNRNVFFVKNNFVWVNDVLTSNDLVVGGLGPAWHTMAIYGGVGENYVNTAYPMMFSSRLRGEVECAEHPGALTAPHLQRWENLPQDLLIVFPNLTGEMKIEPEALAQPYDHMGAPAQTQTRFSIKDEKSRGLVNGESISYDSVLVPHGPDPDVGELANSFSIISDEPNVSVLRYGDVLMGINDDCGEIFVGGLSTDACAFYFDPSEDYWVVEGTFLGYNGEIVWSSTVKDDFYGLYSPGDFYRYDGDDGDDGDGGDGGDEGDLGGDDFEEYDDGNNGTSCEELWDCGSWKGCIGGFRERSCSDLHECGTLENKPVTREECPGNFLEGVGSKRYDVYFVTAIGFISVFGAVFFVLKYFQFLKKKEPVRKSQDQNLPQP